MDQGIKIKPTPITAGENVSIEYQGLLNQAGANEIYLHTGFGMNNDWDKIQDIKMEKSNNGWQANIEVNTDKRFYFCFHDNAGKWDNNNGKNWAFEVHNGKQYSNN